MKKFSCDFETTTDLKDCRVWAYACCEIGDPDNFIYGNSLDDFMKWCSYSKANYTCYFHNLKFDGSFIIDWLLKNGFEYVTDKKDRHDKTFNALITDTGIFYQITVWFHIKGHHTNKVIFQDSLKILNFSVEAIAKGFNLPIRKLKIDYNAKREIGHDLTLEEIDYIRNDVEIISRALDIMFKQGLNKMTIASDALTNFKTTCPKFRYYFPKLKPEADEEIRLSYKGGFTYCSPVHASEIVGEGLVFDVNSLYPSRMKFELMPYGEPVKFQGKYKYDPVYRLFIQTITCSFKIKPNKIPSIQLKHCMSFMPNEYIEDSKGELVTLSLTNPDLELFFKQYDVEDLTYECGYKFKCMRGIFNEYIDHWTEEKIKAKKDGNAPQYLISKLMLNSLYGKFGTSITGRKKIPVLVDDDVRYITGEREAKAGVYLPIATFITSYARKYTIETCQSLRDYTLKHYGYDCFCYADTDSSHIIFDKNKIDELKQIINIDDYELGAWKHESSFKRAKFLRQKCYIEEDYDGKINVTVAGLPKRLGHLINFDNFKEGFTTEGLSSNEIGEGGRKLRYKHVDGGVVLVETDFTIK